MPVRAFAFDLDETLADVEHHHGVATRALLEVRALEAARGRVAFEDVTGKRTRDIIDAFRTHAGIEDALDDLLAERHHAFLASIRRDPPIPLPGAVDVVEALARVGPLALVTSGYHEDALATLDSLGLHKHFRAFVTGEDVTHPKPHPEPYVTAARELGVPPADVLAFEDSVRGVQAAKAAGCRVVAIPNPRNTRVEDVRAAGADAVLASLLEALPVDTFLRRFG